MSAFQLENLRDSDEGLASLSQNEGLLVTVHLGTHICGDLVPGWSGIDRH